MSNTRFLSIAEPAARRLFGALKSPRAQRVAWAVAVIVFFGGLAVSMRSSSALISAFRPDAMLVIVFVLCPLMTVMNMLTTRETALLAGVHMGFQGALRLAVMSAAANHLPVPGGLLLRTAVVQAAGGRLKDAGLANLAAGIAWMSATFLFAGACALSLDIILAAALLGLGAGLFVGAIVTARSLPGKRAGLAPLMIINLASAATYTVSIFVALKAFGADWSFTQAAVVAVAGVIGAAASITPSGLGVREAAAAGLALFVGTDPAAAFAATAAVHVAMAVFTGGFSFYFFIRSNMAAGIAQS